MSAERSTARPRAAPESAESGLYGAHADLYDALYAFKDYAAEARTLRQLALRHAKRPCRTLLDVACGTGAHLAEFARWYRCVGVDRSGPMLRAARRRLPRMPLHRGSMSGFRLHRRFDVVTCLFSSIGYESTARRRRKALANLARHVAPGGVLLVEPWLGPRSFQAPYISLQSAERTGLKLVRLTSCRRARQLSILEMHYAYVRPGRPPQSFDETHRLLLTAPAELLADLRAAGLRPRWVAGGLTGRGIALGVRPLGLVPPSPKRRRRRPRGAPP